MSGRPASPSLWRKLAIWAGFGPARPWHLNRGTAGEKAARAHLERKGFKFLAANFAASRGEIDLIFRDGECLVFVEVKTRSDESWTRPASAVSAAKRKSIARTAAEYLRLLKDPRVPYRYDIVEVIMDPETMAIREIRHIEKGFTTEGLWRRRS